MPKDYSIERIKVPRFNEESGFYTTPQRSKIMSKIKGKNTKPELAFRKALYAAGYRYRIDYKKLIGRPDIVLKKIQDGHICRWRILARLQLGRTETQSKDQPRILDC
ncbi:hypothetical protein ACU8V7_11150 [Zobellia nedashkovskayae]